MKRRKKTLRGYCRSRVNCVYLLHLETPLKSQSGKMQLQSLHYLGRADNLTRRLRQHRGQKNPDKWGGSGSNFLWNCNRRGIRYFLVRTWAGRSKKGSWELEVKLKARKNHKLLCPVCLGLVPLPETCFTEEVS